jgi:hypothetical protein
VLEPLAIDLQAYDEAVDRVVPARIMKRLRRRGATVLVALAGVQTNQFPRARDLARQFTAEGARVMIGGFHVSGSLAMAPTTPPECQQLVDEGVTLVAGEVEARWADLLRDAATGRLQGLYDFLHELPDLQGRPLPRVTPRLQRRFAVRGYGTLDAGRGCPFNCSFCTIINVQGHAMRTRGARRIVEHVRAAYGRAGGGIRRYFFTDDNFARNPDWEAVFDGLITLRAGGVRVDFMMQVDTAASRLPRFVEKAAAAGCVQVFIGMESLREDNLLAAGKRQNRAGWYGASIDRWHEAGVVCHVGYIIGFPHDTPDRVAEDVARLRADLAVDQASFFILTPLPGSRDHRDAVERGAALDADFNNYDSFRPAMPHPRMSAAEWLATYRRAWTSFYSFDQMREALLRQNPHTYWGLFKCFLWYRAAMIERTHPMVTGFVRLKDRRSRRPGLALETVWPFWRRRSREVATMLLGYGRLLGEMHRLWIATRISRAEYRRLEWFPEIRRDDLDLKRRWRHLHTVLRNQLDEPGSAGPALRRVSARLGQRLDALARAADQAPAVLDPAIAREAAVHGVARPQRRRVAGVVRMALSWPMFVTALAGERY